jgi:hypothetical protein
VLKICPAGKTFIKFCQENGHEMSIRNRFLNISTGFQKLGDVPPYYILEKVKKKSHGREKNAGTGQRNAKSGRTNSKICKRVSQNLMIKKPNGLKCPKSPKCPNVMIVFVVSAPSLY